MDAAISPNGGSVRERRALEDRFRARISANPEFTRKTVSYQGNRRAPGFRWIADHRVRVPARNGSGDSQSATIYLYDR